MKHRISLFASFVIFLAIVVSPAVSYAKDIEVGTSVALTGKYARTGQEQLQGFQMWVEEVNARGGLLGQKVHLVSLRR
jgi:branched-chain amino acid transport system substrate-binding protein